MPNKIVDLYRKYLADTGQQDDSTDYDLTEALGTWAQQNRPQLFDLDPTFGEEFAAIRDANAPSLAGEFGRGLKSGTQGLASTALGGLGLLTDGDYLKEKAASFERDAAENAPTIGTIEAIAPGRRGIGALFSKDAARYSLEKLGSVAPSIVEGVVAAGAGAALGSAVAPGPGTIAGAAEGLVARGLIKSAIRSLVKKGVAEELLAKGIIKEASEEALEQAVRAGAAGLADKVGIEAMAIGAKRGLAATNLANSFLLNAGDVASEGADTPTTLALGLISAIPDSILPGYVVGRMFPGVKASAALPLAKQFIGDRAMKAITAAGIVGTEAGTEYFQEAVNVVARNLKEGKDAMEFTPADLRRFREAGIAGGFGGGLAAPSVFLSPPENTTADIPPAPPAPPPPVVPPPPQPFAPLVNPMAGLSEAPDTAGVVTPFDQTRGQLQNDQAGNLLAEQQAAINQQLNPPPPTGPSALEAGLAMAGETPELARERELRRRAFGMAGAPVPNAADPEQIAAAEAQQAGLAMAGNVPAELAAPIPAVPPNTFFAPPASGDPEAVKQDRAQYDALQAQMAAVGFDKVGTPEFNALWQQSEDIKNRHGGMPPPTAEQITLSQLPADIVENVTGAPAPASAGVQPVVPTAPPPRSSAAAGAAPSMEQQGPGDAEPTLTPASIAIQKEGYKLLQTFDKKKDAQAAIQPGKNYRLGKSPDGKVELWFKPKAARFSVGFPARGEPDILNWIEDFGGVRSKASAKKTKSGEYDRQDMTFNGVARLLLRDSENANAPADVAKAAHDAGLISDGYTETLNSAIQKAVAERQRQHKQFDREQYAQRFEIAFLGNEHPRTYLRAGQPISIDELNVGDVFHVNKEKFTVKGIDENGNVTIEDGISRTIPAGTPVFPDKGEVTKGKQVEAGSDFDAEMAKPEPPAANAGEVIPTADMPFNLAGEQQDETKSAVQQSEEKAARDAAVAAENAKQGTMFGAPPAPVAPAPVPDAVAPKPAAPVTVGKFQFGPVVESAPTMDFRNTPEAANLTPDQWAQAVRANMALGVRASRDSSKADSRIALAMQAPDGRVIVTGLTLPDRTLNVTGQNIIKEPTLQRMGVNIKDRRVISAGGNKPALLVDAIGAGFKPLAILHFSAEAGRIHETFPSQAEFDAAWGQTPKTEGRNVQPPALRAAIPRAQRTQAELEKTIEELGDKFYHTTGEAREAVRQEIRRLYAELDRVVHNNQDAAGDTHPPEYRQDSHSATSIQATRVNEFQRVMANLQQLGMRVDVFSRELLAQTTVEEIGRRLMALQQEAQTSPDPAVRAELTRRAAVLQERLADVQQAAGVTYSPWHIALAADDVGNASANNFVTLLHEAAEALTMRLPVEQHGAVRTAINSSLEALRARAAAAAEQTGVPLAQESSPTDLLAETLAQEMAAAGVADARSLAQAILRWVKNAYYQTAMALQAAFGGEPNPTTALDWYENQLRREVSGDYNYSLGNMLDKYIPSALKERVRRFTPPLGAAGTPGSIPDFLDPVSGIVRQPSVESLNRDALNWDLEYRLPGDPGTELDIPDPEARARIKGGVLNSLAEHYEKLRLDIAPDMPWNEFFALIKRTAEEDPKLLIETLNQRIADSGNAKIGGERMTDPMNREAQVEVWGRFRKLALSLRRQYARNEQTIADGSRQISEAAQAINKLEGDLRNAALHDDTLRARAKELARDLAKSITTGRTAANLEGSLAEAIRQEEGLLESDPIPERYQNVLKQLSDGTTPIFDYIRAIAELDLPLNEMTTREIVKAIRGGGDHNQTLAQLGANKPLAVALATLARKNADQVDQIQLGWLRDTSRFREIHAKLEEIKAATGEQLRELGRKIGERGKAAGLAARLQASYMAKRRRQQAASDRVARAEANQAVIVKAIGPTEQAAADAAQAAGGAQYEWAPEEGAVWTAMRQDAEGNWRRHERTLRFRPDGSAVDGDQLRQDIAGNVQWLTERRDQTGKPRYNQIASQTYALQLLDSRGQQQRTWNSGILNAVDRFVRTPIASARSLGGPAMQRVIQMLNRYQFILRNYAKTLEAPAAEWQHEFTRMRTASGLTDNGEFIDQVYRPAMYFLSVNPGLEEGPAVRQATALARRGLQNPQPDFNERFAAFIKKTREVEKKLLDIAEQYGVFVDDKRLGDFFRRAIPKGILTGMRALNGGVVDVITKDMQRAGWKLAYKEEVKDGVRVKGAPKAVTFAALDPRNADTPEEADAIYATLASPDALRPLLSRLFTPSIIGQWLEPFIRKPGQEPFSHEGEAIPQALVGQAWQQSGGDVLTWIDRLGEMVGVENSPVDMDAENDGEMGDQQAGDSAVAAFRLSMLRQLDGLFGYEAKLAYDASQVPGLLDPHGAKPHAMMDARVSDLLPPEHVDFATYEPESIHRLLARVAYHGAFGRNAKNIQTAFRENMNYLKGRQSEFETLARLHTSSAGRQAEAAARGWNYDELKTASKRYSEMKDFQSQLEAVLGVSANSGPLGDFHKSMSLMNFVVGQIVDNPKTAAYNIISPAMRPFAQRSLGPKTISNTAKVYAQILQTGLGSLFQSIGLHLFKGGRYADTIGNAEGRAFSNLPVGVVLSDIGHSGDNQEGLNRWLVKPLKIARNLQRKGLQLGGGTATEFPRLAVVPGMGVITSISNIEVQAAGAALAQEFEQLVHDGIDYMAKHPDAANNPSFLFKPSDLYRFKLDQPLFDWWKQKTVEYNLGNIEDIVRAAARRQAEDPAQRTLTEDQAMTLSMMNQNEFSGNSSINTTPGWLMTNPFLRMVMPLMRWPLWMMSAVHEAAKPRAGENAVKPMLRAIGTLALWNLPMGIAFSMLMDEYDKRLLGKKSNLPAVSGTAALPLVGLPLTMMSSKDPVSDLEAMLVRSARAGNIYGLGADVVAQTLVGLDPSTGQRSVSLDQRVLVMSQLTNISQALLAYRSQGYANWGSVARPLLMAMGGNGVLHSVDITNNLLGLDNAQSRLVQRASSSNWIRTAAQELDYDIRKGSGTAPPTPMSAHTREMYLAALANDRADFLEQYRLALNAARETVADDPTVPGPDKEKEARTRVLASWQSRSPMSVLASKPTPQQIQRMLSIMDPQGQESVREAMNRYQTFTEMISPTPVERFFSRQMTTMQNQMNGESLRRQMTGGLLFSGR